MSTAAPTLDVPAGRFKKRKFGSGHAYYLDGRKLDSVTKLLQGMPKPALVEWASRSAAEEADANWAELSTMSSHERIEVIRSAHRRNRDEAANKGTQVHALAERLSHDEDVPVPELLAGHVEAAIKFLDEWQVEVIATEVSGYNLALNYAGTFDLLFRSRLEPGKVFLGDYKTNRTGIYGETALQLEAYSRFDAVETDGGAEVPLADYGVTHHVGIWIRSDGYTVYDMESGDDVWELFTHSAAIARAQAGDRGETRLDMMKGREAFVGGAW